MNREWVLYNPRESLDHIESTIREMESGNDTAFDAWIEFIYRDLNRARNGRKIGSHLNTSEEDLRQFQKMSLLKIKTCQSNRCLSRTTCSTSRKTKVKMGRAMILLQTVVD